MAAATVLIVDETPATADPLAAHLRQSGYDVRVAATTAAVHAALTGWVPDAAILDVGAADRAGLVAAEALAWRSRRPLLIALLRPGPGQALSAEDRALFDYAYSKIVSPDVLADRVTGYLAKKTTHPHG